MLPVLHGDIVTLKSGLRQTPVPPTPPKTARRGQNLINTILLIKSPDFPLGLLTPKKFYIKI